MNATELVAKLSETHGVSKAQAKSIVDGFLKDIVDAAASGAEVSLPGFGKFKVKATPEPGFPNKPSDAAAERRIRGQDGGSRSVLYHETPSFRPGCTLGESGCRAVQPPRVPEPELGTRRGSASRYSGWWGAQDAAWSVAAVHPAGPHASARIVWRAVTMVASASAPAPRRMISLRA